MKLISSLPGLPRTIEGVTRQCECCHRKLDVRAASARKVGIRLRDSWYCSASCFSSAAEKEIARLLKSAGDHSGHAPRMPLGLNLISRGLLSVEQLKRATETQKATGDEIGEILIRDGFVTEKQLTAVRAADWGCPVFNLPKHAESVKTSIPRTLSRAYSMVPVHHVAATNLLLIGFVHAVEYGVLYAIERMTGCDTKPCFVTPGDFAFQMENSLRSTQPQPSSPTEHTFENILSAGEIVGILCLHGLQTEADEARIENGKDYLWARLKSEGAAIDLLFRIA
jgi:hypothetical protein